MNRIGVSVIICTYNGSNRLVNTLKHLLAQQVEFPWELIIVDNNSNDGTTDCVNQFLNSHPTKISFKTINEKRQGLNHARLSGIKAAKFDFILFCDDDNWLDPSFIAFGGDYLYENPRVGILSSVGSPVFEIEKPEWFSDFSHTYAVGSLGKKSGRQPIGSYHYGAACFFRKEALDKLLLLGFKSFLSDRKGKGLSSGGDVELCLAV